MKRKINFKSIIGIIGMLVIAMGIGIYVSIQSFNKELKNLQINNINLSEVKDGVYNGEYGFKDVVSAKVKITVKDNKITKIDFIEHKYGLGKKAESIIDSVIDAQGLKVDTVSGATGSSKVILKAIESAFNK